MKYVIDESIIEEHKYSVREYLCLLSHYLKNDINEDIDFEESLWEKGDLRQDYIDGKTVYYITPLGQDHLGAINSHCAFNTENTKKEIDRFTELAKAMRECFPEGRKPGTNYNWRDSVTIISARLKSLCKKYNVTFTNEEAIQATKNYIQSFNGDYRYMQILKYFIFKNVNKGEGIEQSSQLLSFIENLNGETMSNNWTSELR